MVILRWNGFVIAAAIDLRLSVWVEVVIGVLGVAIGVTMIRKVNSKNSLLIKKPE